MPGNVILQVNSNYGNV